MQLSVKLVDRISQRWNVLQKLGSGTYAKVYLARPNVEGFPEVVAIKRYRELLSGEFGLSEYIIRELGLMRRLDHPNIMQLLEVCFCRHQVNAVLEYMPFTLESMLDSDERERPWQAIKPIVVQLTEALRYLHHQRIVHRDLSVGNVFINSYDLSTALVKLGDFNLSKVATQNMTPGMVTLNYRAPEMLCEVKNYSFEIDMWSFGCIVAELLRGKIIFDGETEMEVMANIFATLGTPNPKLCTRFNLRMRNIQRIVDRARSVLGNRKLADRLYETNPQAVQLCVGLLQVDPDQRLTIDQVAQLLYE